MTDPRFAPPAALTVPQLLAATGARLVSGTEGGTWTVVTDSRLAGPGTLFVALVGEVHDAHRFLPEVLETGSGALVRDGTELPASQGPVLAVPDTLDALGGIGRAWLLAHGPSVVGVTGSVGKTTTRAMVASILGQMGPGLSTDGNFNNRIGLPLTLLQLTDEHRWAVVEMGMSEPGEIAALAAIARPRVRVITQVAPVHLEFFDSVEGIADAKGELFADARPGDVLVYPAENPLSARFPRPGGAVLVPFGAGGAVHAVSVQERGLQGTHATVEAHGTRFVIDVPIPGRHQLDNALAAIAATWALGAREAEIVAGLKALDVPGRRMKIAERAGVLVVDDAYNASPASVEAVLRTFAALPERGRRVAALGDMLELGPRSGELHARIGDLAAQLRIDLLVGAGPLMQAAVDAARTAGIEAVAVPDSAAAGAFLAGFLQPGDQLLLKGSRGTRMERALDQLNGD